MMRDYFIFKIDCNKIPDLYEINHAMDPKDNGTVRYEFNMSLIPTTATNKILFNASNFNPSTAFIPTSIPGNKSRGPNGDLDNDTLTNYEEYSYNMPENYNLTRDGPYASGLNPINPDTEGDTLPDAYEIQYNLDPQKNSKTQDMDHDGLTNYQEYTYNMPSTYSE